MFNIQDQPQKSIIYMKCKLSLLLLNKGVTYFAEVFYNKSYHNNLSFFNIDIQYQQLYKNII